MRSKIMMSKPPLRQNPAPTTILLAEDDASSAVPIVIGLQDEGFRALHATDGHWALRLARVAQPNLILLDVRLPHMDGFTVCRTLRRGSTVPIILMTTGGRERERIRSLELGADACLERPFSFRELLARVRTVLCRRGLNSGNGSSPGKRIVVGDIVLDRATRQVWRAGRPVHLRRREFDLLRVLMENAGQAVSRRESLNRVWGEDWVGCPRTLDVHVCWLREKLEDDPAAPQYIQTLRGYGHRFVDPALSMLQDRIS
jgi:DNA-binding response OmpR family regulator